MEQISLVQFQLAVQHVDPQEVLRLLLGREMFWRRLQRLSRRARIGVRFPL